MISCSVAQNPKPVPPADDDVDHSKEGTYTYPNDFTRKADPYWRAWSSESRKRMLEHDRLEFFLDGIHTLDYGIRETWNGSMQPHIARAL